MENRLPCVGEQQRLECPRELVARDDTVYTCAVRVVETNCVCVSGNWLMFTWNWVLGYLSVLRSRRNKLRVFFARLLDLQLIQYRHRPTSCCCCCWTTYFIKTKVRWDRIIGNIQYWSTRGVNALQTFGVLPIFFSPFPFFSLPFSLPSPLIQLGKNSVLYAWLCGSGSYWGPTHWWTHAGEILDVRTPATPVALRPMWSDIIVELVCQSTGL